MSSGVQKCAEVCGSVRMPQVALAGRRPAAAENGRRRAVLPSDDAARIHAAPARRARGLRAPRPRTSRAAPADFARRARGLRAPRPRTSRAAPADFARRARGLRAPRPPPPGPRNPPGGVVQIGKTRNGPFLILPICDMPPRRGSTVREDKEFRRILIFPPAIEPAEGRARPDSQGILIFPSGTTPRRARCGRPRARRARPGSRSPEACRDAALSGGRRRAARPDGETPAWAPGEEAAA